MTETDQNQETAKGAETMVASLLTFTRFRPPLSAFDGSNRPIVSFCPRLLDSAQFTIQCTSISVCHATDIIRYHQQPKI